MLCFIVQLFVGGIFFFEGSWVKKLKFLKSIFFPVFFKCSEKNIFKLGYTERKGSNSF